MLYQEEGVTERGWLELAAFLRQERRGIVRRLASDVRKSPTRGTPFLRRELRAAAEEDIAELARLFEAYGADAARLFGEHQRRRAAALFAAGLTGADALEQVAGLFSAVMDAWFDRFGALPPDVARLFCAIFADTSTHVADVWIARQRLKGEMLREAALLQTIVSSLDEAIVAFESDGAPTYATPALARIVGVEPREIVGLDAEEFDRLFGRMSPRDHTGAPLAPALLPHRRALAELAHASEEALHVRRRDGSIAVLEAHAQPVVDEAKELRGVILTLRDRTERYRTFRELQDAYDELRDAHAKLLGRSRLEAVGELTDAAAHTLNNHLNVLLGHARRLSGVEGAAADAKAIERSARDIAAIVARLQQLARPGAKGQAVAVAPDRIVEEVLELMRAEFAPGAAVPLEVRCAPVRAVLADPPRLLELIASLLLDARSLTPPGQPIRLECEPAGDCTRLRVSAGGRGAPDAMRALTDAREIVRAWGGELRVETPQEGGTTFELQLPCAAEEALLPAPVEPARAPGPPAPAAAPAALGRVLVVDDDADNAAVLAEVLDDAGARTTTAATGAAALAAADAAVPDSALVDLVLPDMSGWDVVRELRRRHPRMRIAVVSGLAADAAPEAAFADAVFRKPIEPSVVLRFLSGG